MLGTFASATSAEEDAAHGRIAGWGVRRGVEKRGA
jgi:hypothetical protein